MNDCILESSFNRKSFSHEGRADKAPICWFFMLEGTCGRTFHNQPNHAIAELASQAASTKQWVIEGERFTSRSRTWREGHWGVCGSSGFWDKLGRLPKSELLWWQGWLLLLLCWSRSEIEEVVEGECLKVDGTRSYTRVANGQVRNRYRSVSGVPHLLY